MLIVLLYERKIDIRASGMVYWFPSLAAILEVLGSNPALGEIFQDNFNLVCFISRTLQLDIFIFQI